MEFVNFRKLHLGGRDLIRKRVLALLQEQALALLAQGRAQAERRVASGERLAGLPTDWRLRNLRTHIWRTRLAATRLRSRRVGGVCPP